MYNSGSKQETELFLVNRNEDKWLYDNIDYTQVLRNGEPFEMIIIKDTDGNTYKKKIKSKHDAPFNLGDYIEWNGQVWLITLLDPNDKVHHSGYMYLCTAILRWQNESGKIVERPVYVEDFTKYSSGTYNNGTITIGDNQYGIRIPTDIETKKLKRDMRFPIDVEGVPTPDVYSLTNRKSVLNNDTYFGRGGTMTLTMSLSAFNENTDKLVYFNGRKVWICDYRSEEQSSPTISPNTESFSAKISGNNFLKLGFPKVYSVSFTDENGNAISNCNFKWNIKSSFSIGNTIHGSTIELYVENEDCVNSSFLLQILDSSDCVIEEIEITIVYGF